MRETIGMNGNTTNGIFYAKTTLFFFLNETFLVSIYRIKWQTFYCKPNQLMKYVHAICRCLLLCNRHTDSTLSTCFPLWMPYLFVCLFVRNNGISLNLLHCYVKLFNLCDATISTTTSTITIIAIAVMRNLKHFNFKHAAIFHYTLSSSFLMSSRNVD